MKIIDFILSTILGMVHMIAVAMKEYQLILGGILHMLIAIPFGYMGIGFAIDAPLVLIVLCLVITHQWLWYSFMYDSNVTMSQLMALRGGIIVIAIMLGYLWNCTDYVFWSLPIGGLGQFIFYHYHETFSLARQESETNNIL